MKPLRANILKFAVPLVLLSLAGCLSGSEDQPTVTVAAASLTSLTVLNYNTSTASLLVIGNLQMPGSSIQQDMQLHASATCNDTSLAQGLISNFASTGFTIQVSSTTATSIYGSIDAFQGCYFLTAYTPNHAAPPAPVLTSTSPTSPSRTSYTPLLFGTVTATTANVLFFSDSQCSVLVGQGSAASFSGVGIQVALQANVTTTLYGESVEAFGNASACSKIGSYTHNTNGPNAPIYSSAVPTSPSNSTTTPLIIGTADAKTTIVSLFSDAACTVQIGTGPVATYVSGGIQAQVTANAITTIYGTAYDSSGDPSTCNFLTSFTNSTVAPGAPAFSAASPATPTRLTTFPLISGTVATGTAVVKFYSDTSCLHQIGSGSATAFQSTGIAAGVTPNATTTIYATDVDGAGNKSACTFLVSYLNNTIPPDPPVFSQTVPASPNNSSQSPLVLGSGSTGTASIQLYTDSACATLISQGTEVQFQSPGITLPVGLNTTTSIYATGTDQEGNVSSCTELTSYAYSVLPAVAVAFQQTVPASPSRVGANPYVVGTADHTISSVQLFNDAGCTAQIGVGTKSTFTTTGIQISASLDAITNIYALSFDIYGNTSSCTSLTSYIYDTKTPIAPGYTATSPVSPNNSGPTPLIEGTTTIDPSNVLAVSTVNIYDSFLCINLLGSGTPATFSSPGVQANITANAVTTLYAETADAAGNTSACTFLSNYTYVTTMPGDPAFTATSPATPSYSQQTTLTGTIATSRSILSPTSVQLYSDSACSVSLATSTPAAFTTTGIPLTVAENATTTVYAAVFDQVGNESHCVSMLGFRQSDVAPQNPVLVQNPDGSIGFSWNPDLVASPSPTYIVMRSEASVGPYTILASGNLGTNYTDYAISNGVTYYYSVVATNSTGQSKLSTPVQTTISASTPANPVSLTATASESTVVLAWAGFNSDMTFTLLRATQHGGPYTQVASQLMSSNYTDSAVVDGTVYYYVVNGENADGDSLQSNEASAEPLTVPGAPTGLTLATVSSSASCGGGSGVQLTWTAPSYQTSFQVQRGSTSGFESLYATTANTQYVDCNPGFNNGSSYWANYYTVAAVWGSGELSVNSNEVVFSNYTAPTLTVFPSNGAVNLIWQSSLTPQSYTVMKATASGGPYTTLLSGYAANSYTDSAVTTGTAYFYVVYSNFGTSGSPIMTWPSAEGSGIPGTNPGAPSNLTLTTSGQDPVLNWSPPSQYNYFNVYRASSSGGPYSTVSTITQITDTFTDTSPLSGLNYYKVTAVWGSFETAATNIVSFRNGVPLTVSITASATAITPAWTSVTGANQYSVYRSTISGGPYTLLGTTASLNFPDTTAVAGTGYFYVISAGFADATIGVNSSEVSGMLTGTLIPSGLTVTATSGSSISLDWAKVTGATSYNIYRATVSSGPYTKVGSSTTTNYTSTTLSPNTKYYFEATSLSPSESSQSSAVLGYTSGTALAPTLIAGSNQVTVNWTSITGATYNVARSTDGATYTTIASGLSGTTYSDPGAVNGTVYFYKMIAVLSGPGITLTSPASLPVTPGITPMTPSGLTVVGNSTGTDLLVSWAKVPQATTYYVYVSTTSGGPWGAPVLASNSTNSNDISSLTAGTTYYIVVTAAIGTVQSGYSSQIAAVPTVTPTAPTVTATSGGTAILISWSAVSGASNYDIQRSSDSVNFSTIASAQTGTTYTDSTAASSTPYFYRFLPHNGSGLALAVSPTSVQISLGNAPLTPPSLIGLTSATTTVNLYWVGVPDVSYYHIYRGTSTGGPYSLIGTATASNTFYTDSTGTAGNYYYYVVTAVNSSAVESSYSNEFSAHLVSGPATLSGSVSGNSIVLNWAAVSGASSYTVMRSLISGGPDYGVITTGVTGTTWTDQTVQNGIEYYYVVTAVFASGQQSAKSPEFAITASMTMNLQSYIELTDRGLESDVTPISFARTQTSLDPTAYDGTVTYNLEIVATNGDSSPYNVSLLDASATTVGHVTVPANTYTSTRLRATFTPDASANIYNLELPATSDTASLIVQSARIVITQVAATKTKLYIPLLTSSQGPTTADLQGYIESNSATSFTTLQSATIYQRDTTVLADLVEQNAWEFEALMAGTNSAVGAVVLNNLTKNAQVASTESLVNSTSITLVHTQFNEGVSNWSATNQGNQYQVSISCYQNCTSGAAANLYKAGLWVNLKNVNQVEVLARNSFGAEAMTTDDLDQERILYTSSNYSNPTVYFQMVGSLVTGGAGSILLMSDATDDSDVLNLSAITNSALTLSSTAKTWMRTSSALTMTDTYRVIPELDPTTGSFSITDSTVVIHAHR